MSKVRVISLSLLPVLFLLGAIVAAGAGTIYVVPDDYLTIQEAVNAATSGDTVVVKDTTPYVENVDVRKSLAIQADAGAYPTVQAADPSDVVFYVAADFVTIEGFTVEGGSSGIFLDDADDCNISENTVTLNQLSGIFLVSSSNNTLTNNTVSDNWKGIQLIDSNNNTLTNNIASAHELCGILLQGSSNNTLTNNNTVPGNWNGIQLIDSNDNTLTNNIASAHGHNGILLEGSSDNTLANNNTSNNDWSGISLIDSHRNSLTNNTALANRANGIDVGGTDPSNHNTLTGNTASGNLGEEETGCGIGLWGGSSHNTLTSNYVSGNKGGGIVLWNSSKNTLTGNTAEFNQERWRDEIQRWIGGGIILLDSSNENLVSNNEVSGNSGPGIVLGVAIGPPQFEGCKYNELKDNIASGNSRHGIELAESSSNTVIRNSVEGNLGSGINLTNSSSNSIYLNNFVNNGQNAFSDGASTNMWKSPDPRTYTYTGSPSISDADGNGVGDISYSINSDKDNYPLMQPFENYITSNGNTYTNYLGNYWSDYTGFVPDIPATIDIDPDTLNLGSEGEWITCYIELPGDHDVSDIDVSTVKLNGVVPAEAKPIEIGDYDGNGIADLMVKFDRSSVEEILEVGDEVEVIVTGELAGNTSFGGTDTIRVINEGNKAGQEISQHTFGLSQNYPNPFNPTTTIEYSIAEDSHVTLKIYNLSGQLVKTLVYEYQTPGHYAITWYGDNDTGQEVASGVYFYHFKTGDFVSTKKMVVLK